MSQSESIRDALNFEERIVLDNWAHRNVGVEDYRSFHQKSLEKFEEFWAGVARELEWFKDFEKIIEPGEYPNVYRWFVGGRLNLSHLCLDRHVKGWRKNKVAIIWEGEPVKENGEPQETRVLTYYDLYRYVNRVAYVLREKLGLKKGDRVAFYMPMIPELPILMLAAARIGVIFTQVFSGFSAEALASRVSDLGAKYIFTADGYYRRGRIVRTKEIADKAVETCPTVEKIVLIRRLGSTETPVDPAKHVYLEELLEDVKSNVYVKPEELESTDILYVLYTSGTTGKPKGIIHDTGGYATILHATMKWVFDMRDDDVYWCTADIGWVTGHSYIVFGPLLAGATEIMYEGAPDFPAPDRWWSIIERYGVTIFYTSPTAVRAFMRLGTEHVTKHDLSTLRLIHSVGEPINPAAWRWLFELVGGGRCPVGSTWWMTETGGILISHTPGLKLVPLKAGTNGPPLPGIEAEVVNEDGVPVPNGVKGYLIIKRPWPGMLGPPTGMYGDPERYNSVYFSRFGYFFTGDYAIRDNDGYIWVLGRSDEVLKVAGHRIGTYELESALVAHPYVAEAAVIGAPDEVKGEVPIAYVVLKADAPASAKVQEELRKWIRERIGAIAEPKSIFVVSKLPKTRSGKIMRRIMRALAAGTAIGDITTLEDEAAVEEVKAAYEALMKEIGGKTG
ncbi:MAG: acetate--CoA ligase [Nitrososphaerota archaeon]|nr:acetate--CoA ligase [Candidatus Calditenuaceae archaeon]MDW8074080.1 acetate--CoA ligase [Nitrososphaerota archaeon]